MEGRGGRASRGVGMGEDGGVGLVVGLGGEMFSV